VSIYIDSAEAESHLALTQNNLSLVLRRLRTSRFSYRFDHLTMYGMNISCFILTLRCLKYWDILTVYTVHVFTHSRKSLALRLFCINKDTRLRYMDSNNKIILKLITMPSMLQRLKGNKKNSVYIFVTSRSFFSSQCLEIIAKGPTGCRAENRTQELSCDRMAQATKLRLTPERNKKHLFLAYLSNLRNCCRKKDLTREMNLAAVLVCVVVVFLTCHMPRLLLNLIDVLNINQIIA